MKQNSRGEKAFCFQLRDEELLQTIFNYDGVMARRQIKEIFWKDRTWRAMEKRLAKLHNEGFISWPNLEDRKHYPIPESVVWIGWKGAIHLANYEGVSIEKNEVKSEYFLRKLESKLRSTGFSWLREPRWSQLQHDLRIVDIRIWLKESLINAHPLYLEEWVNESAFRSDLDYIDFQIISKKGEIIRKHKGVCPDGFFSIIDLHRKELGEPYRARFLVEIDMGTHDIPSFGIEKAAAGSAYLLSKPYLSRFGSNSGKWLVITTGKTRMKNLIQQTIERIPNGREIFYFSTFDQMIGNNFFYSPIWNQIDQEKPQTLFA